MSDSLTYVVTVRRDDSIFSADMAKIEKVLNATVDLLSDSRAGDGSIDEIGQYFRNPINQTLPDILNELLSEKFDVLQGTVEGEIVLRPIVSDKPKINPFTGQPYWIS